MTLKKLATYYEGQAVLYRAGAKFYEGYPEGSLGRIKSDTYARYADLYLALVVALRGEVKR